MKDGKKIPLSRERWILYNVGDLLADETAIDKRKS